MPFVQRMRRVASRMYGNRHTRQRFYHLRFPIVEMAAGAWAQGVEDAYVDSLVGDIAQRTLVTEKE